VSTVAYGALTRKREEADALRSTTDQPPGLKTYVDALAALLPAEVLTAHAVVISNTTETAGGATRISSPDQLAYFFWVFVLLCPVLFLIGLQRRPKGLDFLRMVVPSIGFVGWTMLQPTTAFDGVAPEFSPEWRWAFGLTIALVVGIVAALLGMAADKKPAD
jgi:hypothetical protein